MPHRPARKHASYESGNESATFSVGLQEASDCGSCAMAHLSAKYRAPMLLSFPFSAFSHPFCPPPTKCIFLPSACKFLVKSSARLPRDLPGPGPDAGRARQTRHPMHAPSPQQQPEPRPRTAGGYVRSLIRKLKQSLRPTNPFRTATGVAVTGAPPARPAPAPTAAAPAAGPTRQTIAPQAENADGKSF